MITKMPLTMKALRLDIQTSKMTFEWAIFESRIVRLVQNHYINFLWPKFNFRRKHTNTVYGWVYVQYVHHTFKRFSQCYFICSFFRFDVQFELRHLKWGRMGIEIKIKNETNRNWCNRTFFFVWLGSTSFQMVFLYCLVGILKIGQRHIDLCDKRQACMHKKQKIFKLHTELWC